MLFVADWRSGPTETAGLTGLKPCCHFSVSGKALEGDLRSRQLNLPHLIRIQRRHHRRVELCLLKLAHAVHELQVNLVTARCKAVQLQQRSAEE